MTVLAPATETLARRNGHGAASPAGCGSKLLRAVFRLYLADPGCPFQRGTNENATNGLTSSGPRDWHLARRAFSGQPGIVAKCIELSPSPLFPLLSPLSSLSPRLSRYFREQVKQKAEVQYEVT